jgi:ATP adenylyltransferase
MKRIWSPWRSQYIASVATPGKKGRGKQSLFTAAWKSRDDDRNLIVWRGTHCFVIMNRYPYNSGHLMIVPVRQVPDLERLTLVEMAEIMQTAQRAIRALDAVMRPHGYNFGANLGRVSGDTNFMPVLSDTKVISEDMRKTLKKLQKAFKNSGF